MKTGYVYAIHNTGDAPTYIGSTFQSPGQRWREYRCKHKDPKDRHYTLGICLQMRRHGFDQFSMEILETVMVNGLPDLLKIEGEYQVLFRDEYGVPICNRKIEGERNLKGTSKTMEGYRQNPATYEKCLARQNERIPCVRCGREHRRGNMARHLKSCRKKAVQVIKKCQGSL